jgi:hypothetical protein
VLAPANLYLDVAIDLAVEKNGGKPVSVAMAFEQDAFSQDVRLGVFNPRVNLTEFYTQKKGGLSSAFFISLSAT